MDVSEHRMKELDVRHLACPGPVIELRKHLESGEETIRLLVADELARSNVTRFAESRGASAESTAGDDGAFTVTVTVRVMDTGFSSPPHPGSPIVCEMPEEAATAGPRRRSVVVQVTSDCMGNGDDELGALLMRSFLKTQLQLDRRPDTLIFYNTGVKLCCEGSTVLEDLQQLEGEDVEILVCGTCLNFFQLAPRLAVGRGTDMLEIASRLASAGHVVRP